jgi:hypothetical protein
MFKNFISTNRLLFQPSFLVLQSPHVGAPYPASSLVGTPTKRQVSKRQVSKRPASKRLKRQVYKTSGLQNVRFTKRQVSKRLVYITSGTQNVRLKKKHPYIFCTCGWWKSAGSVAVMFAGTGMAVFYSLF